MRSLIITLTVLITGLSFPGARGQQLQVETLLSKPALPFLHKEGILVDTASFNGEENYSVGLYGEQVPEQISTIVSPLYHIDWNKETIRPVVYFKSVPLRDPKLLTDQSDRLVILVADIGNHGPMGGLMAGAFSDEDVPKLRKELNAVFGMERMVRENSYAGNVYVWNKNDIFVRLTVENEQLDGSASESRNGIKQNGRHGTLTIYNKVSPSFYSEDENYFDDPDIRTKPSTD